MPNNNSKDLLILQKLNKESNQRKNKQHTLLSCIIHMLEMVLLIMLFYGLMILFALTRGGCW